MQLARFLLKLTLCSDIFSVDALPVETKATSLFEIIFLGYFWLGETRGCLDGRGDE